MPSTNPSQEHAFALQRAYKNRHCDQWHYKLPLAYRRKISLLLFKILKVRRILSGYKVKVLGKRPTVTGPCVFAINHIGKMDVEIVSEVLNQQFFLLLREFENTHKTLDGVMLALCGVVYMNPHDPIDRSEAKERLVQVLRDGANVMIFPEGVWNLSPNALMLPLYWGTVEIAYKSGASILPIGIQQDGKAFVVAYGKPFKIADLQSRPQAFDLEEKLRINTYLRDQLASLIWEIWESQPVQKRDSIHEDEHRRYVQARINEWPYLSVEELSLLEFGKRKQASR